MSKSVKDLVIDCARTVGSFAGLTAWIAMALLIVLYSLSQIPAMSGLLPWGPTLRSLDHSVTTAGCAANMIEVLGY